MKKLALKLAVLTVFYGFIPQALAHVAKITMNCPNVSNHTQDKLTNYGTYIAGLGTERVNSGAPSYPLFQGPIVATANIPVDLKAAGYDGSGVSYNPVNGSITCYFESYLGFDPFSISYFMQNARGGTTISSGYEEIKIRFPVGLK